jgi:hypothetical protein
MACQVITERQRVSKYKTSGIDPACRSLPAQILLGMLAVATQPQDAPGEIAAVLTPSTADARPGWWGPTLGGFAVGALIGSAFARPYYGYGYGYPAYYSYGFYAPRPYYRPYYIRRHYYRLSLLKFPQA